MLTKTIKISEKLKKELDKIKVHPRQSYEEIISELVKFIKSKGVKFK